MRTKPSTVTTVSNSSGSNPNSPRYQVAHSPIKTVVPALPLYQKSFTFEKPPTDGNYDTKVDANGAAPNRFESMLNDAEMLLVLNKPRCEVNNS